jgi:UDP-GlcNAc:undecaprenyl-phosphate GlcNAc-1-phosphate transferase
VAAYALTPMVAMLARRAGWVDEPGGRKIHPEPVPLLGGAAVLLALGVGGVVYGIAFGQERLLQVLGSEHHLGILVPALLVFIVGAADDIRGVSPSTKVVVQAMAAAIAIRSGLVLDSLWTPWGRLAFPVVVSYPLTILWFVGVTNAFNLIDGLDGLLASVGAASLVGIACVALSVGQTGTAFLPLALAGALLGFLPWNWHKARVFIGDSGSLLVGFIAAALALKVGRYTDGIALHVMLALCFLPAFETFLSLARRYVSGQPVFSGDRSHIHHVLVHGKGLSVRKTVVMLALIQILFSGIAVVSRIRLGWWAAVPAMALLILAIALFRWVDYVEFRVLWHRFVRALLHPRQRSLASVVGLANAGRHIRKAETTPELCDVLESVRAHLGLSFLAIELTETGRQALEGRAASHPPVNESARRYLMGLQGAPCIVFSGEEPPGNPEDTHCVQTVSLWVGGEDGEGYGRLVCRRESAIGALPLDPGEIRRYLVRPLGHALLRLRPASERTASVGAGVEEARG